MSTTTTCDKNKKESITDGKELFKLHKRKKSSYNRLWICRRSLFLCNDAVRIIFQTIIPEIKKRKFSGVLTVVSNPVDILTTVALRLSDFSKNKVIGSGTVLDTTRFMNWETA